MIIHKITHKKPAGVTTGTFMVNVKNIPQDTEEVTLYVSTKKIDNLEVEPWELISSKKVKHTYTVWYYELYDKILIHDGVLGFHSEYDFFNREGDLFISSPEPEFTYHEVTYIGDF